MLISAPIELVPSIQSLPKILKGYAVLHAPLVDGHSAKDFSSMFGSLVLLKILESGVTRDDEICI